MKVLALLAAVAMSQDGGVSDPDAGTPAPLVVTVLPDPRSADEIASLRDELKVTNQKLDSAVTELEQVKATLEEQQQLAVQEQQTREDDLKAAVSLDAMD